MGTGLGVAAEGFSAPPPILDGSIMSIPFPFGRVGRGVTPILAVPGGILGIVYSPSTEMGAVTTFWSDPMNVTVPPVTTSPLRVTLPVTDPVDAPHPARVIASMQKRVRRALAFRSMG